MEATLVPSRTGLSCLGTDGPTLAVEDMEKVNQLVRCWKSESGGPQASNFLGGKTLSHLLSPGWAMLGNL